MKLAPKNKLTHQYKQMSERTVQVKAGKSVRSSKNWAWNRKAARPSKCLVFHPQPATKEQTV